MSGFETFDIEGYLEDRGIDYHVSGEKNVSRGWINIHCPFPDCGDPSWHCGINLESKLFNCYNCLQKGPPAKLIRRIEGCSYAQANTIIGQFDNPFLKPVFSPYKPKNKNEGVSIGEEEKTAPDPQNGRILPIEATNQFPKIHIEYLKGRKFGLETIFKYELRAVYNLGDYKFRIIIPVFLDKKLITFTSRDITRKADAPYKHQPIDEAIIHCKNTLYNIDSVKDTVLILEGPTDVWRIGDGAVCTFGIQFTAEQIRLLISKNPKNAFIMFDPEPDAQKAAKDIAKEITGSIKYVNILGLNGKRDPAQLRDSEVEYLRKEIQL